MPTYIAIDLKSFYASVECRERGLNPMSTNLVVADKSRTEKTICLAVSPSLKAYGIGGRPRLFEVTRRVGQVNHERMYNTPHGIFEGSSSHDPDLKANPALALDYIVAPPRMSLYLDYSTRIYGIYLRHIAPDDIHVYSVDEVFVDATRYLELYRCTARELAMRLMLEVLDETGITATAGIGTNLYLAKVAMDIEAKHLEADRNGVRIAELDETSYRHRLWAHTPITDFWRVGHGTRRRLASLGLHTMGDIARYSLANEDTLYRVFGKNAELLIDHAWGCEPCTMQAIKQFRPSSNSLSSSQVLHEPYPFDKARVVAREMADALSLNLVDKRLLTDQLSLAIGYDTASADVASDVVCDHYGRAVPRPASSGVRLPHHTSSSSAIIGAVVQLFNQLADPRLMVRRLTIGAYNVVAETAGPTSPGVNMQLDLFSDSDSIQSQREAGQAADRRERKLQEATLAIKKRFGKNALLRGTDFDEGATTRQRNAQIGGHHE
ncbi:MAG: DNA methylase [Bacteroidales bacterium]|nr:DNA methylase [Bacteroidales bacterium]